MIWNVVSSVVNQRSFDVQYYYNSAYYYHLNLRINKGFKVKKKKKKKIIGGAAGLSY